MRRPLQPSSGLARSLIVGMTLVAGLCAARPATAYSVLDHEANIDALWDSTIKAMLQERFPGATPQELLEAPELLRLDMLQDGVWVAKKLKS